MKVMKYLWLLIALGVATALWMFIDNQRPPAFADAAEATTTMPTNPEFGPYLYRKATFAAGCFWGTQWAFEHVPGVIATTAGYCGGTTKNPTYEEVCSHTTGHAESVEVTYDPTQVSYAELLDVFWSSHDPTTLDRQGADVGTNYRSVIFYRDADQERIARQSMKEVNDSHAFKNPIVTQIVPATTFYPAEKYHQDYVAKNGGPDEVYCHVGPVKVHTKLAASARAERLKAIQRPIGQPLTPAELEAAKTSAYIEIVEPTESFSDWELRSRLPEETYEVARHAETERPFTGKYWNSHGQGMYRCPVCGQPLFASDSKFDSSCGWPSFSAPIDPSVISKRVDKSHGMVREEVICSHCGSHLGHVFDDGPGPTHNRFCINSAALEFQHAGGATSTAKPSK